MSDQQPADDWEASVEAALDKLRSQLDEIMATAATATKELERLSAEVKKQGGRLNQLYRERKFR
jgi:hypothetical protein